MSEKELLIKLNSSISAPQNGWSTPYTEGYLEGRHHQRLGKPLGAYVRVGIDEYTLGFRAGYFERKNPESAQVHKFNAPEMGAKLLSK